jgi:hypothetical protein
MAGFQVISSGRFWVITEAKSVALMANTLLDNNSAYTVTLSCGLALDFQLKERLHGADQAGIEPTKPAHFGLLTLPPDNPE